MEKESGGPFERVNMLQSQVHHPFIRRLIESGRRIHVYCRKTLDMYELKLNFQGDLCIKKGNSLILINSHNYDLRLPDDTEQQLKEEFETPAVEIENIKSGPTNFMRALSELEDSMDVVKPVLVVRRRLNESLLRKQLVRMKENYQNLSIFESGRFKLVCRKILQEGSKNIISQLGDFLEEVPPARMIAYYLAEEEGLADVLKDLL